MPSENDVAYSIINIWCDTELSPERNYVIEHLNNYLATYHSSRKIEDLRFQFLELKPTMTIKLDLNQYNLQYDVDYNYDYCHIHREGFGFDDLGAYYFITKKRWKSKKCVEFELEMDALNTFKYNEDYIPTDRTFVKRQLKNRYSEVSTWSYTSDYVTFINGQSQWNIRTPLTSNARIKSVSALTIIDGTATGSVTIVNSSTPESSYFHVVVNSSTTQVGRFFFTYEVYAYMENIDLKSEEIYPPLYKTSDVSIPDTSGLTWSLLYKNKIDPDPNVLVNPVECYLYPSETVQVYATTSTNTISSSNLPSSNWAVIFPAYNSPIPSFSYNQENFTPLYEKVIAQGHTRETLKGIAFKAEGNSVRIYTCNFSLVDNRFYGSWFDKGLVSSVSVNTTLLFIKYYEINNLPYDQIVFNLNHEGVANNKISITGVSTVTIEGKDELDKTDAKNIKLINLPYCPTQSYVENDEGIIVDLGGEWYASGGQLILKDLNNKFKNSIETSISHPVSNVIFSTYQKTLNGTAQRGEWDPKLSHSDFKYNKFVYDSFSKIFRNECLDWDESIKASNKKTFYFDFITSRNIVSKFMFVFPQYTTGSKGTEDYDNILPVARNNEEVLYNSQYLNYLRNGYNYDLKTKERNQLTGGLGLGLSLAGLAGSIALTASGVGAGMGVAGIIGSVAGIAGSAINYAKSTAQAEENIQRKMQETQNQAVSVSNADDYDLLEAYSGNMAKMCTYEVSTQMRNALNDMFYYSGYLVNEQYKPEIDIRYWFDFLQADLDIMSSSNLSKEIVEIIKKKFNEGVTIFHRHTINGTDLWDLNQEKENWEKWIVLANGGAQ